MHSGTIVHTDNTNKALNTAVILLSVVVGLATLNYLYHQTKLLKHQIKKHERDPEAHTVEKG